MLLTSSVVATTLTVGNGVVVKFGSDASMIVRDGLHTAHDTRFTSIHDDAASNQTLPSVGIPDAGDWQGLKILPTALPTSISINGLSIRYAGSDNMAALQMARNAYVFDALFISNNSLGILALDGTDARFSNLSLIDNAIGVQADQDAVPSITNSEIRGNAQFGILNLTPQSVLQATGNWWGDASGPEDAVGNPDGLGDTVSVGVDYGQYDTAAPLLDCLLTTANGSYSISQQSVVLTLHCRNAVSYRLSESNDFAAALFMPLGPTAIYTFNSAARTFTLYVQYKSASGDTVTATLPSPITYMPAPSTAPQVTILAPTEGTNIFADTQISVSVTSPIGIDSVDFYADADKIVSLSSTPYQTTWLLAGVALGDHTLRAVATDTTGQSGTASVLVHVTDRDTTGPGVEDIRFASAPLSDGATLTSPGLFSAEITDPSGVDSVTLSLDSQPVAGGSLQGNDYTIPLSFDQVSNGMHTLILTATDIPGNDTAISRQVNLDLGIPVAPVITAPADGSQLMQANASVLGSAELGSQVQLYLDGSAVGPLLPVNSSAEFSAIVTLPGQGVHTLTADAHSSRGTSPTSVPVLVTYAVPPPSLVITSPTENAIITGDIDITAAVIDTAGVQNVKFAIDGQTVATLTEAPYTWRWSVAAASSGDHAITAEATDYAGNVLQAEIPVTVQLTPPPPPPVVTPYTGLVQSISPGTSYGEQPIVITGQAIDRADGSPLPHALLALVLQVNGFKRQINLTTDDSGSFSYPFNPDISDLGIYTVSVIHPDETSLTAQGQFTINRLKIAPANYNLQAARTITATIPVRLSASAGSGMDGVYLSADPDSQPSGSLPAGISIAVPSPVKLAAGQSSTLHIQFTADNSAADAGVVILVAHAAVTGAASLGTIVVNYQLSAPEPALYPKPSFIQMGVTQGEQALASVEVQNKGLLDASNVLVQLQNTDGSSSVPSWLYLAAGASTPVLSVGQSHTIQVNAAPADNINDGIYNFRIHVTADNAAGGDIPVSVSVTQSGMGNAAFNVADIYTDTLDGNGNSIPGVAGANIQLQNAAVPTLVQSAVTDSSGSAEIDDLPVGHYTFRASAANHDDASGVLTIQPGSTSTQAIFLDYQLVTFQWSVTETDIPDEYNVTLDATYQTEVPAPVVLVEPAMVNLPAMQTGEVFTGVLTITNYGLVRADNVTFNPPSDDSNFSYEFMGQVPTSLAAHQRISIPYKITKIAPLPDTSGATFVENLQTALGMSNASLDMAHVIGNAIAGTSPTVLTGTCGSYSEAGKLDYNYMCANGTVSDGSAPLTYTRVYGQCSAGGGGGSSGGNGGGPDPGSWGGAGGAVGTPLGNSPGCTPECQTCRCKAGSKGGG